MTDTAVFRSIILLPTAPATEHPVRPLVNVLLRFVVASITCVDLLTAAEAEPAVRFRVMSATAPFRELCSRGKPKGLFLAARSRTGRDLRGGDPEELDIG